MRTKKVPLFRITFIATIWLHGALSAYGFTVESNTIRAAEVHPKGVSVRREVVIFPKGDGNTVEIANLPSGLDPSSIRLLPLEDSQWRIGGFEFSPKERVATPLDPRTADAREAVAKLEQGIADARNELGTLEGRQKQFLEMANSVRASLAKEAEPAVFELGISAWEKYEQVKGDVEKRTREISEALTTLTTRRDAAAKALKETVEALNARSGVLRFTISGAVTGPTPLTLHYQLVDAGWVPVYEVRALPAEDTVQWVYKARIWQRTGEDWADVEVSLNSAPAFDPAGLPSLHSLFLDRAETNYKFDSRSKVASVMMEAPAPPPQEAELKSTTTGFFATLSAPVSLKSGAPASVRTAFEATLAADFWSEATPELSTNTWLVAGLTNTLGWPVLDGHAYFYIDGQLVSRRPMPAVAAGEDFELALGRNESIGITRKERLRKASTSGLIDKTRRHAIKYETIVQSRMKVPHRIVLQDRFPVSRNNKIQVDPESPSDVEIEEGTGLFKWERTLEPNDQVVLKTEYTVTYPMEWTVYPEL